jgi:hypothetical protein
MNGAEHPRDRHDAYRKIIQKNNGFDNRVACLNDRAFSTVSVQVSENFNNFGVREFT